MLAKIFLSFTYSGSTSTTPSIIYNSTQVPHKTRHSFWMKPSNYAYHWRYHCHTTYMTLIQVLLTNINTYMYLSYLFSVMSRVTTVTYSACILLIYFEMCDSMHITTILIVCSATFMVHCNKNSVDVFFCL